MEIKKVFTTLDYPESYMKKLKEALGDTELVISDGIDDQAVLNGISGADVAILRGDLDDRILHGQNLKWIHCNHAGLNQSARKEVFDRMIKLTGSAGRSAPVLAEHALYFALGLIYHANAQYEAQKKHAWRGAGDYSQDRGLYGKTMGIIGLGYTGKELAERAKQFHMQVIGYNRSNIDDLKNVDRFYCMDRGDKIDDLLKESDIIVLCCRLSDETYHLIGNEEFRKMKRTALLINMARGAVVDTDALVEAMNKHIIAGYGSDVFEEEPLPEDSPVWDLENLMMTPHCTPEMPDMPGNALGIIIENIHRYTHDLPLLNQLSIRDMYSHR